MLRARALPAVATALVSAAVSRTAGAWVEAHVVADDVRITIERDAPARVEHRITVRVAGGPLRALDLRGVDGDAEPEAEAFVVTERDAARKSLASAREVTAELIPPDIKPQKDGSPSPSVLRLRLGEKGVGRGTYVVQVRYRTRLAERGFVTHEGTVARVRWQGLTWEDGFDSARVTFDLPAGPVPPHLEERPAVGGVDAPLVLSTVRRKAERDEIELLRPYSPTGEAISWGFVADGRAFAKAAPPERPADAPMISIARPGGAPGRLGALWLAAATAGFLGWALLVARKVREVTVSALAAGTRPAPLIPMPLLVRAPLSAAALGLSAWLQVVQRAWTPAALALLFAAALVIYKVPVWPRSFFLRRPGRWLPVAERDAFAPPPRPRGAFLDVSTRAGKALFVLALAAFAGLHVLAADVSRHLSMMIALDAVLVLALFGTGRMRELPPRPVDAASPFLREVAGRLGKTLGESARIVGRIRVPDGEATADELRLSVVPRPAAAGFRALETGVVIAPGMGGAALLPGVILRYTEGSPCEAQLGGLVRAGKLSRGKKPGEVAVVFTPRLPTTRVTADLAARLARAVLAEREPAPAAKPRERSRRTGATGGRRAA
jgi:hypothetical protein